MRDDIEILYKVGNLVTFDGENAGVEMVAEFFNVGKEAIKSIIKKHREELISDGMEVLRGRELWDFKTEILDGSSLNCVNSLTIIPRRAILRIGKLLRYSEVANKVKSYLSNVEKVSTKNLEQNSVDDLLQSNKILKSQNEELHKRVMRVEEFVSKANNNLEEIKETMIYKRYDNPSHIFNELVHRLGYKFGIQSELQHFSNFYKIVENWLGIKLPKVHNTKKYILSLCGIDFVEKLINGILEKRIILSSRMNWIDLDGVYKNEIEFEKVKREFKYSCAYCGEKSENLLVEHIIPQSHPDSTDCIYNIVPACHRCNRSKYDNGFREWYLQQDFFSKERLEAIVNHYKKYRR